MPSTERQGWLGSLRHVLNRAETTHAPRPADSGTVVEIPNGLEKLRKAIVAVQNDLVEAQAERADYAQAWEDCKAEISAHMDKNASRQRDLRHRLQRLQEEWVSVTVDLGIRAEIAPYAGSGDGSSVNELRAIATASSSPVPAS